jgi:tRNA G10  N-methylase Trm11
MRKLGYAIEGSFAIKNPRIEFALTKANGKWVFGFYEPNKNEWEIRKTKPFNYSHALEVKLAKSIVNLAVGNNSNLRLVDPCCGIGTVLIEARTLDLNIQGFEINPLIKRNCNTNLEYFGFVGDVKKQDMHTITEHYDIAVLDIPYGQFSFITYEEQVALIKKTKEISDRSVIITMEDMCDTLIQQGLNIIEKVKIEKSNAFSRYITICSST